MKNLIILTLIALIFASCFQLAPQPDLPRPELERKMTVDHKAGTIHYTGQNHNRTTGVGYALAVQHPEPRANLQRRGNSRILDAQHGNQWAPPNLDPASACFLHQVCWDSTKNSISYFAEYVNRHLDIITGFGYEIQEFDVTAEFTTDQLYISGFTVHLDNPLDYNIFLNARVTSHYLTSQSATVTSTTCPFNFFTTTQLTDWQAVQCGEDPQNVVLSWVAW